MLADATEAPGTIGELGPHESKATRMKLRGQPQTTQATESLGWAVQDRSKRESEWILSDGLECTLQIHKSNFNEFK